jgi:MFS family permease
LSLVNIIAFYSSTVFVEAGNTEKQALWASWGFGLCNFLFAIPALWVIDTFGRRSLLLATFPNMAWSLLAAGLSYLIPGDGTGRLTDIAAFIFIFTMFYSAGQGPVCHAYGAEVFPSSHREIGMAFAVAVNAGGAAILGVTFPSMLERLTLTGAFGFYCVTNILALVLIYLLVPETCLYTLEELDDEFNVPTGYMINCQVKEVLPWRYKLTPGTSSGT